jgi:hypothetical protein
LDAAEASLTKLVNNSSNSGADRIRVDDRFLNVSFDALLGKVRNAKNNISRSNVAAAIEDIESACKVINQKFGEEVLVKSCGPNGEVTKLLGDGAWLELFRDAMLRVNVAVTKLDRFKNYSTPVNAMESDWPRALAVSVLWAFLAAVFAAAVLLYRRSVLWDQINDETLKDCTPNLATAPEWLRTPIDKLEGLTPLEAMRYQDLRASLSDYIRDKPRGAPDLPAAA